MGIFGSRKYETLSGAVRAGDTKAVRKMLIDGVDPNNCDPNDTAYPINYAMAYEDGSNMVQLLIDHGADVNIIGRGNATPLAKAESRGYSEIASILRKAGAKLRSDNEEYMMDPRFRLQMETKISSLVFQAQIQFPTGKPEHIIDIVEPQLNFQLPPNMPQEEQNIIHKELRQLIIKEYHKK